MERRRQLVSFASHRRDAVGRWTHHWEQSPIDPAKAFFAHDAGCPVYEAAEARIWALRIVNELRPVAPQLQLSNLWRSRGMREGMGKHT